MTFYQELGTYPNENVTPSWMSRVLRSQVSDVRVDGCPRIDVAETSGFGLIGPRQVGYFMFCTETGRLHGLLYSTWPKAIWDLLQDRPR